MNKLLEILRGVFDAALSGNRVELDIEWIRGEFPRNPICKNRARVAALIAARKVLGRRASAIKAEYLLQRAAYGGDEDKMHGLALLYIEAYRAADQVLKEEGLYDEGARSIIDIY